MPHIIAAAPCSVASRAAACATRRPVPAAPTCSPLAGPGGLPAGVVTPPGGEGTTASAASAAAAAAAAAVGLLGGSPETGLIAVSSNASLASSAAANGAPGQDGGNKTLYLGNLHPFVTEQTLQDVFAGLGGITELKVRGWEGCPCARTVGQRMGSHALLCVAGLGSAWTGVRCCALPALALLRWLAARDVETRASVCPATRAGHQGQGHGCERRLRVCQV